MSQGAGRLRRCSWSHANTHSQVSTPRPPRACGLASVPRGMLLRPSGCQLNQRKCGPLLLIQTTPPPPTAVGPFLLVMEMSDAVPRGSLG